MIWRSLRAGGWIHAMEFDHESKVYKLLIRVLPIDGSNSVILRADKLTHSHPFLENTL
jgi:hypothetical protein